MSTYRVEPYDEGRFIVLKNGDASGYVVEIDPKGNHQCGCRHGEANPHKATCKHVAMVLEELNK